MKKLLFLLLTACSLQVFSAAGGGGASVGDGGAAQDPYAYLPDLNNEELQALIELQQNSIESSQEALERAQTTFEEAQRNYRAAAAKLQEKIEARVRMLREQARRDQARRDDEGYKLPIRIKGPNSIVYTIKIDPKEKTSVQDVITMLKTAYPKLGGHDNTRLILSGESLENDSLIMDFEPQDQRLFNLAWD